MTVDSSQGDSCGPAKSLSTALAKYNVTVPSECVPLLERYCHLLWRWNERINLTRHTDFDRFVARDLIDTVQLAPLIGTHERVMDIGSGGGVPGLVLAVIRPDLDITLTESVMKKARALQDIVQTLDLPIVVEHCRAEHLLEDMSFDTAVARAVGPMWRVLRWLEHHWDVLDRLLLIQGPNWLEQRAEARHKGLMRKLELRRVASYRTPGHDGDSVVLQIERKGGNPHR